MNRGRDLLSSWLEWRKSLSVDIVQVLVKRMRNRRPAEVLLDMCFSFRRCQFDPVLSLPQSQVHNLFGRMLDSGRPTHVYFC